MQIYLSGQNLFESKEGRRQVIQAVLGARELRHELTYGCLCSNSLLRTEIIHVSGIAYKCFFLHEVFPCIIRKKQSLFAFWSYDIVYTLSILVYFFFLLWDAINNNLQHYSICHEEKTLPTKVWHTILISTCENAEKMCVTEWMDIVLWIVCISFPLLEH